MGINPLCAVSYDRLGGAMVEVAVLRIVGQETVRYVSNIKKYYVIYKTSLEIKETKELRKEL